MKTIRIGNGCGFWGDSVDAPLRLAQRSRLDYLTLEYLAELTMSILARQKERDPDAGYAGDFLDVLQRLTPILQQHSNLKIITNAGGMNPTACARRAKEILQKAGLTRRIAVVSGDDLLPRLDALLPAHPFTNLDTGELLQTIRPRVVSANAYLGARPIAEALRRGAEIVITGRVADASLTAGPALHEFGWRWDDWDQLSAASIAGHLIECGAQVCGGLWCNWRDVKDWGDIGYPYVDLAGDGSFTITSDAGPGVNRETLTEQLLYEVGDPSRYLTPDVVADFTSVSLETVDARTMRVTGVEGDEATSTYKVSIAYRDGFMASGTLVIAGPDAVAKAQLAGDAILKRIGQPFDRSNIECLGAGACAPGVDPAAHAARLAEVVLRVSVHDCRKEVVERFAKEFAPLVTSGPPGVTGYTTGRPSVREVFAYWPALVEKSVVEAKVEMLS
jgi:Acyclic terpene utilisation family protein AtuA